MCVSFTFNCVFFFFFYSLPLTGINIRQYCKNSLLPSCYIQVIYLLSNILNSSVIQLILYVGINSAFMILTLELEIFSTDMVSREQSVLRKKRKL